jgi:hypothetical protein
MKCRDVKGNGRGLIFGATRHLPGGTEESHENLRSG